MDDVHRFFHQPLRPGDIFPEILEIDRGFHGQRCEMNIDAHQGLDDFIMQLPADPLAFFLLRQQKLAG